MKIALNTRFLLPGKMEGIGWFTHEIFSRMVRAHPEHEFHFLFDRRIDPSFLYAENVYPHILFPPARHPFLWKIWFEYAVPRELKRINADFFISPDGFCSLKTQIPTILVIHDLAFEHDSDQVPPAAQKFYKKNTPKFARKAEKIVTVSNFTKKDIAHRYGISDQNIFIVHNAAGDQYHPVDDNIKEAIKQQYTAGKDYFLFVSAIQPRKNLIRLMQAFDRFKKQSGSDMKLLVAGSHTWARKETEEVHASLAARDDIIFAGHLSRQDLARILASAFALTYVSLFEGFGIPILEAMNCDVPVITSNTSSMPEVAGNAALLVDPYSIEEISEAMMRLYLDDTFRQSLIENGKIQRLKFNWDQSAKAFWEVVEHFLGKREE